jgi:hypothetical protein
MTGHSHTYDYDQVLDLHLVSTWWGQILIYLGKLLARQQLLLATALLCQTAQLVQVAQMLTTSRTLLCICGKERHEKP